MKRIVICDNDEFDNVFPFCLSEGLGIEFQSFWDPTLSDQYPTMIEYQLSKIKGIGLRACHGPFADLNCGSYDPSIREISRERMTLGYQTAQKLEATHIIFHHGYVPHTSPPKNWIPRFVHFWQSFMENMPKGVYFHIENMLELSPEIMEETIDAISDARVNACLDIGHASCNSTTHVLKWIERLGNRIGYVHLHDNDGTEDQHLGIGNGRIPFHEVCASLNHYSPEAIWALEVQSADMRESYLWLKDQGFVM